jgi:hypothetical protein
MSEVLTVSEVARRKKTTRQAVYAAITSGALKATKTRVEVTGVTEAAMNKWQPNPRSVKNAGRPRKGTQAPVKIDSTPVASDFDPASIPGVSTGAPKVEGQWPCRCVHSGCQGSKFMGVSRFQNLCDGCREVGHLGDPRSCRACEDDSATGAI